ncbi:MAG: hypothetical protein Q9209_000091 [Squamulea sp. 1 TL-2023]
MISIAGMKTFAARLKSFNVVHSSTKKRSSNVKGAAKLKWSHESPDPAQLANAGFFYDPKVSAPDNTTCYLCHSQVNGWEKDDNAIEEHANLAAGCGWAAIARIEQNIENGINVQEDPMGDRLMDARRMTFGANWPHEDKELWVGKTEKMIEGGWYYCPAPDSDDFVKCCYCGLGVDGWEPKDNPYDEHERRSPNCAFFALSASKTGKTVQGKKGRASKASRASIQSVLTTASEDLSMVDMNSIAESSILHNGRPVNIKRVAKGVKKAAKGRKPAPKLKGKASVTQQEDVHMGNSFVEPEDDDFEIKMGSGPMYDGRGMKRTSDEMSIDDESAQTGFKLGQPNSQQPPFKRRATRSSVSYEVKAPISTLEFTLDDDTHMEDTGSIPAPPRPTSKKTGKKGRKGASSSVRKASTTSTATKASLRATIPNDEEIDAALEADLDRPLTDDEGGLEPPQLPKTKTRRLTKTRPGSRNMTASTAPVRRTTRAGTLPIEDDSTTSTDIPAMNSRNEAIQGTEAVETGLNAMEHAKQEIIAETDKRTASKAKNRGRAPSKSTKAPKKNEKKTDTERGNEALEAVVAESPVMIEESSKSNSSRMSDQVLARPSPASEGHEGNTMEENVAEIDSSVFAPPAGYDESGNENGGKPEIRTRVRGGGKRHTPTVAKKGKASKKVAPLTRESENVIRIELDDSRSYSPQPVELEVGHDQQITEEASISNQPKFNEPPKGVEKVSKPRKGRPAKANAKPRKLGLENASVEPKEPAEASPMEKEADVAEEILVINRDMQNDVPSIRPQAVTPQKDVPPVQGTPKMAISPQSSDAENQPPSARPSALRPPLSTQSPSKAQNTRVVLSATTPTASPSKRNNISRLQSTLPWKSIDFEKVFIASPLAEKENQSLILDKKTSEGLTSPEKKLTVEEWIRLNAKKGEDKLRNDCERLVGRFEGEGVRALKTLEGIVCAE